MAGGLDKFADKDGIKVVRNKQVLPVHYSDLISGRDMSTNYELQAGDTLSCLDLARRIGVKLSMLRTTGAATAILMLPYSGVAYAATCIVNRIAFDRRVRQQSGTSRDDAKGRDPHDHRPRFQPRRNV
jgi:hypothetical protein